VSIILGSLLWTGGIVSLAGRALQAPPDRLVIRFCEGECICDGGVADAALMARVCPEGWEKAFSRARRQRQRNYRRARRERIRKMQEETPSPPPSLVPNV
jgi:hypothetical protein